MTSSRSFAKSHCLSEENADEIISAFEASAILLKSENPGDFPFQYLPTVCQLNVLSFLEGKEKLDCMKVCKEWSFIKNASLWRHVNLMEFCSSQSVLSSFVAFLESFNCRLKSVKLSFNDLKTDISLNVLLESEVVSKLESLTIDWGRGQNDDEALQDVSNLLCKNRRQQRRFISFFSNICSHLPHLTQLDTIFDWSPNSINTLTKLTSLKSLTLSRFPGIIAQFEQSLFSSLICSLPCLEVLCVHMKSTLVGHYQSIEVNSASLRTLDLSKCHGFTLTEATLPCMDHLILPPKLKNPLSLNNSLCHPTMLPQLLPEGILQIGDADSQEETSKRNSPDDSVLNNDFTNDNEVLVKVKSEALITECDGSIDRNMFQEHHHHQSCDSSANNSIIIMNKNREEILNVNNNDHINEFHNDDNNHNGDNDDNCISNKNNNNNNNNDNNRVAVKYRCVSEVLDKGCPCLINVNGFPVAKLKQNSNNNKINKNKNENKNKFYNKNNEFFNYGDNDFDNGSHFGGCEIIHNDYAMNIFKCEDVAESVLPIEEMRNANACVNDYVNLDKNVNNNTIQARVYNDNNNCSDNNNNNNGVNDICGDDNDFVYKDLNDNDNYDISYESTGLKAFLNSYHNVTDENLGGNLMKGNKLEDEEIADAFDDTVNSPSGVAIFLPLSPNTIANRLVNNVDYDLSTTTSNANLYKRNYSDDNCYLKSYCPSFHDQHKE